MFDKTFLAVVAAAGVLALTASPALADVSFDSSSGTGFVGKGDVQTAFAWNNKQLQANAHDVSFSYDATVSYAATCTFVTGDGTRGEKTHDVAHRSSTALSSAVDADPRQAKGQQVTGFVLTGFAGEPTTTGRPAPVVGGPCMGNPGHDGTWTSVTVTGASGGLSVTFGGVTVPLASAPVA